jgi:glycosyltransferase involved in cell wall biosynthesis
MELLTKKLPNSKLRIAGPSSMPEYYQKLSYPYDNIKWSIRHQSDNEVSQLFKWADTVVLPYIEASQSGVLHIAQSFGVPVVASAVGALGESITHEKTGLLVKPGNPLELAKALLRILTDTTLRQTVIQNIVTNRNQQLQENLIGAATNSYYQALLQRA